jgi:hypothetical protein
VRAARAKRRSLGRACGEMRVVICGSMAFYSEMLQVRRELDTHGVASVVPDPEDASHTALSAESYAAFKQAAAEAHVRRIRHPRTTGILVLNFLRHGIRDYIGPSTFAEIAVAHAAQKRIYILNGLPAMYVEELRRWRVRCLGGELEPLIGDYGAIPSRSSPQSEMFAEA